VNEGGLVACTRRPQRGIRPLASFVDRILKGAKPQDLPVELPTNFRRFVNKKTAQALKLTLPQSILQQADAVIG
jgi:putative ABC transport system substrate-binding protein